MSDFTIKRCWFFTWDWSICLQCWQLTYWFCSNPEGDNKKGNMTDDVRRENKDVSRHLWGCKVTQTCGKPHTDGELAHTGSIALHWLRVCYRWIWIWALDFQRVPERLGYIQAPKRLCSVQTERDRFLCNKTKIYVHVPTRLWSNKARRLHKGNEAAQMLHVQTGSGLIWTEEKLPDTVSHW